MVSILDIVPTGREVPISDTKMVTVYGLSIQDIAKLVGKYPELKGLIGSRKGFQLTPEFLLDAAPKAVAHAIVLGLGLSDDDEEAEDNLAAAAGMPAGVQVPLVWAIIEETIGGSFDGPFVQKLVAFANSVESAVGSKVPGTNSPKPAKS